MMLQRNLPELLNGNRMRKVFRSFILYNLIGISGAGIDFCVYSLLTQLTDLNYLIINTGSILLGISNNFFWNMRYNFKKEDHRLKRYVSFLSVGIFGLIISTVFLWILIEKYSISVIVAKAFTLTVIAIIQFILNKYITFRR